MRRNCRLERPRAFEPGTPAGQRNANPRRPSRFRCGASRRNICLLANPTRDDFAALLEEFFANGHSGEGQVVKGIDHGHRKRHGHRRRRPEGRRPHPAEGIRRQGQGRPRSRSATKSKSMSSASKTRLAKPICRATRPAAKRAGSARREVQRASASKASSSTRSRAASPSISTAPWPSCRAARSTSVRSATSPR